MKLFVIEKLTDKWKPVNLHKVTSFHELLNMKTFMSLPTCRAKRVHTLKDAQFIMAQCDVSSITDVTQIEWVN